MCLLSFFRCYQVLADICQPDLGYLVCAGKYAFKSQQVIEEELTKADLRQTIKVLLSETETFVLIDVEGCVVSNEAEEADGIVTRNETYREVR